MIVGLVGFIGSGKGSVADILVERHDYVKESFANSVKDSVSAVFGWDRSLLEGDTEVSRIWREQPDAFWSKKLGREFSPRLALQLMGTEAGRDVFHEDLWVHTLMRRCENNPDKNYVIADVRFPNEIREIVKSGGKVVRVRRGNEPEWYELARECNFFNKPEIMQSAYPEVHYSEWAWVGEEVDYTIYNDSTIQNLNKKVDVFVNGLYNI